MGRSRTLSDESVQNILGYLLRFGVLLSAGIVLAGALVYLARHGRETPNYHVFVGEPADLRTIAGILQDARSLSGRGLIQLGLLVLIAIPVVRVVFSIYAFSRQRDNVYILISLAVLGLLLYGLLQGQIG